VALDQRISSAQCEPDPRSESWFWAEVKDPRHWKTKAPPGLAGRAAADWGRDHYHVLLSEKLADIDAQLRPGSVLTVQESRGELTVLSHVHLLLRGYEDAEFAPFVAAQWRHALRDARVTESFDARALLKLLLKLRRTDNAGLRDHVVKLDEEIQQLDAEIARAEAGLNEIIYALYDLTQDERRLVEEG